MRRPFPNHAYDVERVLTRPTHQRLVGWLQSAISEVAANMALTGLIPKHHNTPSSWTRFRIQSDKLWATHFPLRKPHGFAFFALDPDFRQDDGGSGRVRSQQTLHWRVKTRPTYSLPHRPYPPRRVSS